MTAAAVLLIAALIAPHAAATWRSLHTGRAAIAAHRRSIRYGVRLGRWQTLTVALMTLLLIGAAR